MAKNHFGGFGGGANMQQLMRQAQKLQEQMAKAQEELDEREYSAQAGGGMVSVTVSRTLGTPSPSRMLTPSVRTRPLMERRLTSMASTGAVMITLPETAVTSTFSNAQAML